MVGIQLCSCNTLQLALASFVLFQVFLHNIQNIIPYFSNHRSWSSAVGNIRCKNNRIHKGGDGNIQMLPYQDIFVLDIYLGTNDKKSNYHPPNHTMKSISAKT
jgi:hypothetical protein